MIRNELKNDFHAVLKNSVSLTLGPGSRRSRLLMVLEMVHICLPYSSIRLMLLIGKTYNPCLV